MTAAAGAQLTKRITGASRPNASLGTSGPGGNPREGRYRSSCPRVSADRLPCRPAYVRTRPEAGPDSALSAGVVMCLQWRSRTPRGSPTTEGAGIMSMYHHIKDKVQGLGDEHGDKTGVGLDKAGDVVDEKTGGQHSAQIDGGVEQAKNA